MIVNSNQIRAARALLDWTVAQLGERVGVGATMISAIETGRSSGSKDVLTAIIYAFQAAGVELTEDGGVKPRQSKVASYRGKDGFKAFFDDVYEVASTHKNPDICITNVNEAEYDKWLGSYEIVHANRMTKLENVKLRVLMKEHDIHLTSTSYCEYKWIPEEQFADVSLYIYGDKVAFIEFSEHDVSVTLVESPSVTLSLRKMFEMTWKNAHKRSGL
jgi:transcriptional regulator with XRE-family HTH domain